MTKRAGTGETAWLVGLTIVLCAACGSDGPDAGAEPTTSSNGAAEDGATPGVDGASSSEGATSDGVGGDSASDSEGGPGDGANGGPGDGSAEGSPDPDSVGLEQPGGTPSDGTEPAAVPLDDLVVEELPIPGDLPGCGSPYPHDPAVDEATGKVYYAGSNESCIGEYDPETGAFQAWPTTTADAYPHGLVVIDGRVYFTGIDENLIGRLDPATGEMVEYPVNAGGPHTPTSHDGALWFTAQRGGQIGRLDLSSGEAEVYPLSAGNTGPYGIWPAPDGSLWVALFGTNRLAHVTTDASPPGLEEHVLPEPSSRPRRLAVDAAGRVWFTDYPRRALGRFDVTQPEGERVTEFATPGGGRPYGIAIGPDGRVWYNDEDAAEIVGFDQQTETVVRRLPLQLDNPGPVRNMVVDQPRRRLWLAISNVGRLAVVQF